MNDLVLPPGWPCFVTPEDAARYLVQIQVVQYPEYNQIPKS